LGKVIFYQSLRRVTPQLPGMDMTGLDSAEVMPRLRACFEKAHRIDYHAVFREDIVDRLPYPAAASTELRELVVVLNTRDFAHLPQDVVGAVFERLIPPEDRHALGQYFTPEPLVDLIVAMCVRNADDAVLDPTCGTGTFLIRAYDRLQTRLGVYDHGQLLSQLWGVDVAPFPAELATINLFRQRAGDPGNFPRILNEDFFDIIPGGSYRFPPLKAKSDGLADLTAEGEVSWINEPIPMFDAIVGNFPYIGASQIERTVKGYRNVIAERLKEDWFRAYPAGFTFGRKTDDRQHRLARAKGLSLQPFLEKAKPTIDYYADLYISLFWHAAAFLEEGGRMGIVTSNAWLDVGYGYALQRFLLDHFKIVAILESRCEPWFLQAAVNTVVTIVERCSRLDERDAHPVRFVQVKQLLDELIPWDLHLEALSRWNGLNGLVQVIETAGAASEDATVPTTWENNDFRIRSVRQGALRHEVEEAGKTVKWGRYLRAGDAYFDLHRQAGRKLAPLHEVAPPARGGLTRINEFFHLSDETIKEWGIDTEFCWTLMKSPGETNTIRIDPAELGLKLFVCRKTKDQLQSEGKLGTLRYIEWGEQQEYTRGVQRGMKWPDGPWVRNRQPGWYALPESETKHAQSFISMAYGDRLMAKFCPQPLVADNRLYFLDPGGLEHIELAAILNCSVTGLFMELAGRVTLGDGALELKVEDARDYLEVPDIRQFSEEDRRAIVDAFQPLLERPIGSVFEEVHLPDRKALDAAVLRALGLEPDHWQPRLYEGLTKLIQERVQLGQMRGEARRSRPKRAAKQVAAGVLEDLLPNGPKGFPDDFLSQAAREGDMQELILPDSPLSREHPSFGRIDLIADDGTVITVSNKFEARFVQYAQAAGHGVVRLPKKPVEVARTVNNYAQYLRDLHQRLYDAYFTRTLDQALAERSVKEVWSKFGLPEVEE
jgi:hypothetical protein